MKYIFLLIYLMKIVKHAWVSQDKEEWLRFVLQTLIYSECWGWWIFEGNLGDLAQSLNVYDQVRICPKMRQVVVYFLSLIGLDQWLVLKSVFTRQSKEENHLPDQVSNFLLLSEKGLMQGRTEDFAAKRYKLQGKNIFFNGI